MDRVEKVYDYIIEIAENLVEKEKKKNEYLYDKHIGPVIEKFIKSKKYVIKNSMILRKLDPMLDLSEADYFYEVYSGGKGFDDLKELSNKLYQANSDCFTYLEVVRIGEFTFDFKSNFKTILRVVSLLDRTFQKLPYQTENGLRYIDPNLMRLDIYTIYCNPTTDIGSWRKAYQEEQALDKLFPLKGSCPEKDTSNPELNEVYNKWISDNSDIILAGDAVLNILLKVADKSKKIVPVSYFVVLTQNPDQQIAKLRKAMKPEQIKVKKEKQSLRYFKERSLVYLKNRLVAVVYNVSDKCYPFTELNDKLKIATVQLLIKFYLIEYSMQKDGRDCILYKIKLIQDARHDYLEREGLTGIEKGPMQAFHHICWGDQVSVQRQLLIAAAKRKYIPYRYKPWEKFSKAEK